MPAAARSGAEPLAQLGPGAGLPTALGQGGRPGARTGAALGANMLGCRQPGDTRERGAPAAQPRPARRAAPVAAAPPARRAPVARRRELPRRLPRAVTCRGLPITGTDGYGAAPGNRLGG